jgi:uncharacterized protein YbbK (DUF523 family)
VTQHPKPVLVLSKCLELEACRYNGATVRSEVVRRLFPYVDLRPVCPEVEIGLGTPRAPIRLVGTKERQRLIQPATGRDLTPAMTAFAKSYLDELGDVDGFVLKGRSPSCGIENTKIHSSGSESHHVGTGPGVFGRAVKERFPQAVVASEEQLEDVRFRHHFLVELFLRARLRSGEDPALIYALLEPYPRELME